MHRDVGHRLQVGLIRGFDLLPCLSLLSDDHWPYLLHVVAGITGSANGPDAVGVGDASAEQSTVGRPGIHPKHPSCLEITGSANGLDAPGAEDAEGQGDLGVTDGETACRPFPQATMVSTTKPVTDAHTNRAARPGTTEQRWSMR